MKPRPFESLAMLITHHGRYVIFGLVAGLVLASLQSFGSMFNAISLVTAYASLALLGATLLFGPLHVLKGGRPIISTTSRRHLGVWSGVFAIIHVAAGLNVHLGGRYLDYFLTPGVDRSIRLDVFGAANDIGLVATLLVLVLMIISRDQWVRSMGAARWKRLQRGAYWLTFLIFAHGFLYQAIEGRPAVPIIALFLILAAIIGYQMAARAWWRGRELR